LGTLRKTTGSLLLGLMLACTTPGGYGSGSHGAYVVDAGADGSQKPDAQELTGDAGCPLTNPSSHDLCCLRVHPCANGDTCACFGVGDLYCRNGEWVYTGCPDGSVIYPVHCPAGYNVTDSTFCGSCCYPAAMLDAGSEAAASPSDAPSD
jgi:hypothetical protein